MKGHAGTRQGCLNQLTVKENKSGIASVPVTLGQGRSQPDCLSNNEIGQTKRKIFVKPRFWPRKEREAEYSRQLRPAAIGEPKRLVTFDREDLHRWTRCRRTRLRPGIGTNAHQGDRQRQMHP